MTSLNHYQSPKLNELPGSLAANGGAGLVGYQSNLLAAQASTVRGKLQTILDVFDFMTEEQKADAKSYTGALDATDAFQKLAAAINLAGGGHAIIPPGKYKIGRQTLSGAFGASGSYLAAQIFTIKNCTHPVVVECKGAIIKVADGMRFGTFHPVTGAVYNHAMPFSNGDYAAGVGKVFEFLNNSGGVFVKGALELDGNQDGLILGGEYGDTGRQLSAYGLHSAQNSSIYVENLYTHHHGLDGIFVGHTGTVEGGVATPITLINVRSEYNARQGLSWVGGIGLTAINCKFNYTGRGTFHSSPAAGVDIEQEGGVCRNGNFINCEMGGNFGQGLVSDNNGAKNVSFNQCRFYGTVNTAIWPRGAQFKFTNCLIAGGAYWSFVATDLKDRTVYKDCLFSADEIFDGVAAQFSPLLADFNYTNPMFDNCDFVSNNPNVRLQFTTPETEYRNCRMVQKGYVGVSALRGTFISSNSLTCTTGSVDPTYSIFKNGGLTYNGVAVAGLGSTSVPYAALSFMSSNNVIWLENKISYGLTAPVTGEWLTGDRRFNNSPAVGSPKGWICTASGTPGTWVSEGNL